LTLDTRRMLCALPVTGRVKDYHAASYRHIHVARPADHTLFTSPAVI
jgi:hypothetical protein